MPVRRNNNTANFKPLRGSEGDERGKVQRLLQDSRSLVLTDKNHQPEPLNWVPTSDQASRHESITRLEEV